MRVFKNPMAKVSFVLVPVLIVFGFGITSDIARAKAPEKGDTKQVDLANNTAIELVYIPSGNFMMGSTPQERKWATGPEGQGKDGRENFEGDPRLTRIKHGFWMGRTELTVGQWRRFVQETSYVTDAEKPGGKTQCFDLEWTISEKRPPHPWQPMEGKSWRDIRISDFPCKTITRSSA